MRIRVGKNKCTGCGLCEVACSVWHLGEVNRRASAVSITKNDLSDGATVPRVCLQCVNVPCLVGEEVSDREELGKFVWQGDRVNRCPFNAIFNDSFDVNIAYHCDLCGGDPQCVKVCSTAALTIAGVAKEDSASHPG